MARHRPSVHARWLVVWERHDLTHGRADITAASRAAAVRVVNDLYNGLLRRVVSVTPLPPRNLGRAESIRVVSMGDG